MALSMAQYVASCNVLPKCQWGRQRKYFLDKQEVLQFCSRDNIMIRLRYKSCPGACQYWERINLSWRLSKRQKATREEMVCSPLFLVDSHMSEKSRQSTPDGPFGHSTSSYNVLFEPTILTKISQSNIHFEVMGPLVPHSQWGSNMRGDRTLSVASQCLHTHSWLSVYWAWYY